MAERSPKHGLTRQPQGWYKRVNKRPRYICSSKQYPTGESADAFYEKHFTALWDEAKPPVVTATPGQLAIYVVCDAFLAVKRERYESGRMDVRSMDRYDRTLQQFCDAVGANTAAAAIGPTEFAKFIRALDKRSIGVHARKDAILTVRGLFKWAARPPVRLPMPEYGDAFSVPSKAEFRREKNRRKEERGGLLLFTPEEIRAQLEGTTMIRRGTRKPLPIRPSKALRAMILLGINCAFGNTDIARLPLAMAGEISGGWINYPRHKTGVERRCWLWPETQAAVADYLRVRPKPAKPEYVKLMFLTSAGKPYVRITKKRDGSFKDKRDKIAERYGVLLKRLGQLREGRSFYSLRRSFRTIAAETGQELAIDLVMGHAGDPNDMARVYTQVVLDEIVKSVCQHVCSRVLNLPLGESPTSAEKK